MDRRGFLGAFMAAAAALAGGGAATAALAPAAKTLRKPTVSANTALFGDAIEDSRQMLRRLIKECRVVSWEKELHRDWPMVYRVTFRHAPDEAADLMCDELRNAIDSGAIRDARVDCYADIDVTHLGDMSFRDPEKKRYEVVVTYIVTGAA